LKLLKTLIILQHYILNNIIIGHSGKLLEKISMLSQKLKLTTLHKMHLPSHSFPPQRAALVPKFKETVTLGYWAIRGLGHPIRLLLSYTGVNFVDKAYV
jgi:hypothetical protein